MSNDLYVNVNESRVSVNVCSVLENRSESERGTYEVNI